MILELIIYLLPLVITLAIGAALADYLLEKETKRLNRKTKHDYK